MSTEDTERYCLPRLWPDAEIRDVHKRQCGGKPELRRDILRESMFDWECLHCGYTAQMAYPMIYHDPMNAFMICLRPSGAVSGAEPYPRRARAEKAQREKPAGVKGENPHFRGRPR